MRDRFTRRGFLGTVAAGAAVPSGLIGAEGPIPTRVLGKTGASVTIVALGCGNRLAKYGEEGAIQAIHKALDSGVGYLDTAYGYGRGNSETWVGQVMKTRRKQVFLATKIEPRNGEEATRILEQSLKRLQTDQIDLIHVHGLGNEKDLALIEAKDGVLNALYKLRDQKMTRFIGITSHTDPMVLKTAIERHDIDVVQMALNAAHQGFQSGTGGNMAPIPGMKTSFQDVALPAAQKKNLGIIGMKVMGQDHLLEPGPKAKDPAMLFRYTLSLPNVATVVLGMPKHEFIFQNANWARSFKPLTEAEMKEFSRQTTEQHKASIDLKFRDHVDA
jgi:uncharacterized protein